MAVAVGRQAGQTNQGKYSIGVGYLAGFTNQATLAVSIGSGSGYNGQGESAVCVGNDSAHFSQGISAVAVGQEAAYTTQGARAVAVGKWAGKTNQGQDSVAVGYVAGETGQHANSIVLNASGTSLNTTAASQFIVKPVRNVDTPTALMGYNTSTGEVSISSTLFSRDASGTPEGRITANKGDLFINSGTGQTLFVKTTSGGNTGWVGIA
jgi:hypothetical protein